LLVWLGCKIVFWLELEPLDFRLCGEFFSLIDQVIDEGLSQRPIAFYFQTSVSRI